MPWVSSLMVPEELGEPVSRVPGARVVSGLSDLTSSLSVPLIGSSEDPARVGME